MDTTPSQNPAPVAPAATPAPTAPSAPAAPMAPAAPAAPVTPQTPVTPTSSGSAWGPIAGVVIIVAVLIAGGAYFYLEQEKARDAAAVDAQTQALQQTSNSDEVGDIEAELEATQTGSLDSDAQNLENSF